MIEVYKIVGADGFNAVTPVYSDYSASRFDGTPLKSAWEPLEMEVSELDDGSEDSECVES
jgi:hypothetical protein